MFYKLLQYMLVTTLSSCKFASMYTTQLGNSMHYSFLVKIVTTKALIDCCVLICYVDDPIPI